MPYTPIPERKRDRKTKAIKSVISEVSDSLTKSSWKDDYILNMLWACILAGNLERDAYMKIFEEIIESGAKVMGDGSNGTLCHNYLSTLDQISFGNVFAPVMENSKARDALNAIGLVESMPDAKLWENFLNYPDDMDRYWKILRLGIQSCLFPRSREACDVRILKIRFYGRIGMVRKFADTPEFTEAGLRAAEVAMRGIEVAGEESNNPDLENFPSDVVWEELFSKTRCVPAGDIEALEYDYSNLRKEVISIHNNMIRYFMTLEDTSVDQRKHTVFGIVFYSLVLMREITETPSYCNVLGRVVLRCLSENLITLSFLKKKGGDDADVWYKFRKKGTGSSALQYLKSLSQEEIPNYIDIDKMEYMANEDGWLEMEDINTGDWFGSNTRKRAEEADLKDNVYDKYYDWTSGFIHGSWSAIRDSAFVTCMNPLHRLHIIPRRPRGISQFSAMDDCCKICNLILDEFCILYPNDVISRIRWQADAISEDVKRMQDDISIKRRRVNSIQDGILERYAFLVDWRNENSDDPRVTEVDNMIEELADASRTTQGGNEEINQELTEIMQSLDLVDKQSIYVDGSLERIENAWETAKSNIDSKLKEFGYVPKATTDEENDNA